MRHLALYVTLCVLVHSAVADNQYCCLPTADYDKERQGKSVFTQLDAKSLNGDDCAIYNGKSGPGILACTGAGKPGKDAACKLTIASANNYVCNTKPTKAGTSYCCIALDAWEKKLSGEDRVPGTATDKAKCKENDKKPKFYCTSSAEDVGKPCALSVAFVNGYDC